MPHSTQLDKERIATSTPDSEAGVLVVRRRHLLVRCNPVVEPCQSFRVGGGPIRSMPIDRRCPIDGNVTQDEAQKDVKSVLRSESRKLTAVFGFATEARNSLNRIDGQAMLHRACTSISTTSPAASEIIGTAREIYPDRRYR